MQEITYIFIDGAYLRTTYRETVRKLFGDQFEIDFSAIKNSTVARRAFYYDCIDYAKKDTETAADCDARVRKQEEYLDTIDALEGFHVRRGHLAHGRMKQQKEVDVLLAVDMMNHAFSRNMTKAVLISGDRDFRPVVQSVTAAGTYVQVMYRKETGSRDLGKAADLVSDLDLVTLINWTRIEAGDNRGAHFPSTYRQSFSSVHELNQDNLLNWNYLRDGCVGSTDDPKRVRAYQWSDGSSFLFSVEVGKLTLAKHTFRDFGKLEEFLTLQYGPVAWC
jgi:uncharacterized LabA/DUF88 family protein